MSQNRYAEILETIQNDLGQVENLSAEEKETLLKLAAEININLDDTQIDMIDHPDLFISNLNKTVAKIEKEHPVLANLIKQVIDTLSNIGI